MPRWITYYRYAFYVMALFGVSKGVQVENYVGAVTVLAMVLLVFIKCDWPAE